MEDGFRVDLDQLDGIVARLSALAGFITDQLDAIDTTVAGLGPGVWDSAAAQAYSEAHQIWAVKAREFAAGVGTAQEGARLAHERIQRAVDLNGRMLGGS
ncbi:WXG100 family type VII secretion target [Nocardia sp. NPDC057668]|uniref:WXG100 family type VII secretion target n=1 Tax=Nocardia sp. NPDC057668 TaxID=3346202 RepID=UPI00366D973E